MIGNLRTSLAGLLMIAALEGLRLKPYKCKADRKTIGYGHTSGVGEESISVARATELLMEDVARAEAQLSGMLAGAEVTQSEWDALVSLTFNVGDGKLKTSRLIAKVKSGDKAGAAQQFAAWRKHRDGRGALVDSDILIARRAIEADLFRRQA